MIKHIFSRQLQINHIKFSQKQFSSLKSDVDSCYNMMEPGLFPFKTQKWMQIAGQFQAETYLEGKFDGKSVGKFLSEIKEKSENNPDFQNRREFLVVGRSNVGKSSLINTLLGSNIASISKEPGKTRHLYFYRITKQQKVILVDAPGYGFAKGDKHEADSWGRMILQYISGGLYLHRVLCLIDIEHGFKDLDFMLFDLLESKSKPFMITLTKTDKVNKSVIQNCFQDIQNRVKKYQMCSPIIHATSTKTNFGIHDLKCDLAYLLNMELLTK